MPEPLYRAGLRFCRIGARAGWSALPPREVVEGLGRHARDARSQGNLPLPDRVAGGDPGIAALLLLRDGAPCLPAGGAGRRRACRLRGRSAGQAGERGRQRSDAGCHPRIHACGGVPLVHQFLERPDALSPASGGRKPVPGAHRAVSGFHPPPQRAGRGTGSGVLRIVRPAGLPHRREPQSRSRTAAQDGFSAPSPKPCPSRAARSTGWRRNSFSSASD